MSYYALTGLLNFLGSLTVGTYCLTRRQPAAARVFGCWCLSVAGWSYGYYRWQLCQAEDQALFWTKALMAFAIVIPVLILHFTVRFLDLFGAKRRLILAYYLVSGLYLWGDLWTPHFISRVTPELSFRFWPKPGWLFHPYLAMFLSSVAYSHYLLWQAMRRVSGFSHRQIQYVFSGVLIAFAGGSTNFFLWYGIPIPPLGNGLVLVYIVMVTYAILRHQLFDIEVIIRRTVVFTSLLAVFAAVIGIFCFWLPSRLLQLFGVRVPWVWLNLLSVVIVVGSFDWLRTRLLSATDRYLFQTHYDVRILLKRFTEEVLGIVDLQQLVAMTVATLTQTMKLTGCDLWLRDDKHQAYRLAVSYDRQGSAQQIPMDAALSAYLRESPGAGQAADRMKQLPIALRGPLQAIRDKLCLPLVLHDELIGFLALGHKKSDAAFTPDDMAVLLPLIRTLAIAITNARLSTTLAKTEVDATFDALTGLFMRRAFLERAALVIAHAIQQQLPWCVLMLDLDHFKQTNDAHGHLVGDAVLQEIATRLSGLLRQHDLLGRFGGEELILLLPETTRAQAAVIAERLRAVVGARPIQTDAVTVTQTISVGLASCPEDGATFEGLLARADKALYVAKQAGRNRVGLVPC